ncbi:MAG: Lrp/AsnC family transcriptional regulator [Candidatus Methylacidiphilales bacterium]|nr:Lrp/AsnC family transcriptional regulator [Candidatus Methylacidiphilales bacterium]
MDPILSILEANALASPESIAVQLKMTVDQVRERIRHLEEEKVILGYKAIVNDDKTGRKLVQAVIEVRISPERDGGFDRIASRISRFDEVQSCRLMSGGYDLLVVVEGGDLRAVASFVSQKLSTIQGVLSTATHFQLKTYKEMGTLYPEETFDDRLKVTP